jgi:hypothetical protein
MNRRNRAEGSVGGGGGGMIFENKIIRREAHENINLKV